MTVTPFREWTVHGRWGTPAAFSGPAEAVVVHHSVTNTAGRNAIEQARDVEQVIWTRRRSAGFSMIAYSFIVARSAAVFEGRGFEWRNGANTSRSIYGNHNTVSICFAGDYRTLVPSAAQLAAAGEVIRDGVAAGHIRPNPPVIPHSQVHATACPGDNLRAGLAAIDTRGVPMPLHSDAEAAKALGFWNGSDPQAPATREHAAIMTYRAYRKAVEDAEQETARAVAQIIDNAPQAPTGPHRELSVRPGESVTVTGVT